MKSIIINIRSIFLLLTFLTAIKAPASADDECMLTFANNSAATVRALNLVIENCHHNVSCIENGGRIAGGQLYSIAFEYVRCEETASYGSFEPCLKDEMGKYRHLESTLYFCRFACTLLEHNLAINYCQATCNLNFLRNSVTCQKGQGWKLTPNTP